MGRVLQKVSYTKGKLAACDICPIVERATLLKKEIYDRYRGAVAGSRLSDCINLERRGMGAEVENRAVLSWSQ